MLLALRAPQLDQLRVLDAAVHAADGNVQQARHAVEEAEAEHIEFEEAHDGREDEAEHARLAPALETGVILYKRTPRSSVSRFVTLQLSWANHSIL